MNSTDGGPVSGAGDDTDDAKVATPPCPSPLSCPAADNNTLYTLHSTLYTLHSNLQCTVSQQDTTRRLSDAGGQQQPRARPALGSSVKTDNASII